MIDNMKVNATLIHIIDIALIGRRKKQLLDIIHAPTLAAAAAGAWGGWGAFSIRKDASVKGRAPAPPRPAQQNLPNR